MKTKKFVEILLILAVLFSSFTTGANAQATSRLRIAFVSNGDLYFNDGSKTLRVTGGWKIDKVAIAPTGDRVAFAAKDKQGSYDLFIWQPGRWPEKILQTYILFHENLVCAWSPDGRELAFVQWTPTKCEIVIASEQTKWKLVSVYRQWFGHAKSLTWGQRGITFNNSSQIFLLDLQACQTKYITQGCSAVWSSSGKKLAFLSRCPFADQNHLALIEPETNQYPSYLSQGSILWAIWAPNNERLAFAKQVHYETFFTNEWLVDLYLKDLKDVAGKENCLTCNLPGGRQFDNLLGTASRAVWTSNQEVAVFCRRNSYYLINVDTGRAIKLPLFPTIDEDIPPSVVVVR